MKLRMILTGLTTLLFAATASALPIFPTPTGGTYTSTAQAADVAVDGNGVPTEAPTASIGMVLDDGTLLACVPATPTQTVTISYTVPNNTGRQEANAVAYALIDCGEDADSPASARSDNTAFYFFVPAGKPSLSL